MSKQFLLYQLYLSATESTSRNRKKQIMVRGKRNPEPKPYSLYRIKYNSKSNRNVIVILTFSVPMPQELCNKYIDYVENNKPFLYVMLHYEDGSLVVDLDDNQERKLNGFFKSLINFCLSQGMKAREIDTMIGRGNYGELALSNPQINDFVPIILTDIPAYEAMTECALCTSVVPIAGITRRTFFGFSFSEKETPRMYAIDAKRATTNTEYLNKAPMMFFTNDPENDERKVEQHCVNAKGLTYLVRQDLVPEELHQKLLQLSDKAKEVSARLGSEINAVIVTASPTLQDTVRQTLAPSMLIVNLFHFAELKLLLENDKLLYAFLTFAILQSTKNMPTQMTKEMMLNFSQLGCSYDGKPSFDVPKVYATYKRYYENAIANLAVHRAIADKVILKTYLEYYLDNELGMRLEQELQWSSRPTFYTILLLCAVNVAVEKRQIVLSVRDILNKLIGIMADKAPFYKEMTELMSVIWDKSDGENIIMIETGFRKVVGAMFRYSFPDRSNPF